MSQKQLTKSANNRLLTGTIAGICEYLGWSRDIITFVRILYVLLAFGSWGTLIPVYFIASWIIPSAGRPGRPRANEGNWSNYTDHWQNKMSSGSSGRKMKEAEPVEDEKKDDWSDF